MKNNSKELSRRNFLKLSGVGAAAAGSIGLGLAGYQSGKDFDNYPGRESFHGQAQDFNRKKFEIDDSPYTQVDRTERVDARTGVIFARSSLLNRHWNEATGVDGLPEPIRSFYKEHPVLLEEDLRFRSEVIPNFRKDNQEYGDEFILAQAWSDAMHAVSPEIIKGDPKISDFPKGPRYGEPTEPYKLKSKGKTSELIKYMSYQFGSQLTGITKLNPNWVYKHQMPGRSESNDEEFKVPDHWNNAIVIGSPMSWDPMFANPNYGTSYDAYSRITITAYRLATFIRKLGYAARPHTPGMDYDLMVVPVAIDAGLGEQGRNGCLITPEFGANIRPAIITTNMPLSYDKPIKFGVDKFCDTCKICADKCPSGSISKRDKSIVRGYKRWSINVSTCYNFWFSNLGNIGCRLCIANCPYTRKSNWLHRSALNLTSNDPTGLSHKMFTEMQKGFYPSPDAQEYYSPSFGGSNASYREAPWWLKTDDFLKL